MCSHYALTQHTLFSSDCPKKKGKKKRIRSRYKLLSVYNPVDLLLVIIFEKYINMYIIRGLVKNGYKKNNTQF